MPIEIRGLVPLLQVFDMPASIHFYRDLLGCDVVMTDGKPADDHDWVMLSMAGAEFMLNTAYEGPERPSVPEPARMASHSDTGLFFGCPDVDVAYEQFREQGVDVEKPTVTHYNFKALSFKDPDGYHLCFQWPTE